MTATFQDAFAILRNRVRTTPSATLDVSAVDDPGSTVNVIAALDAEVLVECDVRSTGRAAALLIATASGTDLDTAILQASKWKLPRLGAGPGRWQTTLNRTGTAGGSLPAGTILLAGSYQYTLDQAVSIPAGVLGPFQATWTCTTLGSATSLAAGQLVGIQGVSALFDPTLTVTAVGDFAVGGSDPETDHDYRARYAQWDAGLDRNLSFLAAGAMSVPGVAYATAIEDIDANGLPIGSVSLYIGDVNGRANAALVLAVQTALLGFRLSGQRVAVVGAVPVLVTFVLHVAVLSGYDQSAVEAQVAGAVVAYVNGLAPGSFLRIAAITSAMATVAGVVLESSAPSGVISPSTDVAPAAPSTIFRTTVAGVSFA